MQEISRPDRCYPVPGLNKVDVAAHFERVPTRRSRTSPASAGDALPPDGVDHPRFYQ
jgi:hypothetical protein